MSQDFMVATQGGVERHGPIFGANSYQKLMRGGAGLFGPQYAGVKALDLLRPCVDGPPELRANATLTYDEWKDIESSVMPIYQRELRGVGDLLNRGLRRNFGNPFGTMLSISQTMGDMTEASVNMRAGTPPEHDRIEFGLQGWPVPIFSKSFMLDEREVAASRMNGDGLDTMQAEAATRVVSEKLEETLFAGNFSYGGYTLYGYTTHPNRNTGSLTAAWNTLGTSATPYGIFDDVMRMMIAARNDDAMPPFVLYIPYGWSPYLDFDYYVGDASAGVTTVSNTIRQRLMSIEGLDDIVATDQLTSAVLLVSMNREVVDVGYGFEPRLVQWDDQGGMVNNFRVISIMTFRIKRDHELKSGIVHFS